MRQIPFSPPDITEEEIAEVVDTLRSGWITTGPKTKKFESMIAEFCGADHALCVNSATAGLELILRLFEIGEGDEVITTPYTFAATGNVILHVGATPIIVDVKPGEFNINPEKIRKAVTKRTKAVIPVDIAGYPCDYDEIHAVLNDQKHLYHPAAETLQQKLERPLLLVDAAHSFGASYKNKKSGTLGDFTVFSFHAVKNLTTAEGGAITFNSTSEEEGAALYHQLKLLSLHGQSKDAFAKMKAGGWQYAIELPGYKCNMTDIMASIGIAQLKRFTEMQAQRKKLYEKYTALLRDDHRFILPPFTDPDREFCYHLLPVRIRDADAEIRGRIIQKAAEQGIALNVHFIPMTLHPAYTKLGYSIETTPEAFKMYQNEITLPLYSKLSEEDAVYVVTVLKNIIHEEMNHG